nr:hypothetical protein [Selenomonas noxia]
MWIMFKIGRQIAGIALGVGLLGAGTTAQASVPQDALVVGGIEYGASENYVRSVYGAPHKVETKYNPFYSGGQAVEWEYGSGFDITFVDGAARRIEIDARNGIQTKENIAVGTDVNTLIAAYGQPDTIRGDDYIYFVDGDQTIGFAFEIENNRVDEIKMGVIR